MPAILGATRAQRLRRGAVLRPGRIALAGALLVASSAITLGSVAAGAAGPGLPAASSHSGPGSGSGGVTADGRGPGGGNGGGNGNGPGNGNGNGPGNGNGNGPGNGNGLADPPVVVEDVPVVAAPVAPVAEAVGAVASPLSVGAPAVDVVAAAPEVVDADVEIGQATPAVLPGAERIPPLSAVDPPLTPLVPDDGLGWGIIAALVAAAVAGFVVRHATLRGAIRDAQRSATRDPLTGLANRRLFDEILARELARARRRSASVALLLVDLDGFKRVNDTRGHAAGDEVLRTVAETLTGRVRASDLPARIGGDEFAVVLPDCPAGDAARIAEDLRGQIARAVGPAVTACFGVAAVPDHADDGDGLLGAADAALYRAKAEGRNRVTVATPRVANAG